MKTKCGRYVFECVCMCVPVYKTAKLRYKQCKCSSFFKQLLTLGKVILMLKVKKVNVMHQTYWLICKFDSNIYIYI